jgi:conjugal transfer pilus assembly protein TraB
VVQQAEQYHPVIQVGAGNVVNIVFRYGFSLNDDDQRPSIKERLNHAQTSNMTNETGIPEDIINKIQTGQSGINLGDQLNNQEQG